ncbi:hypothetical protein J6590_008383 [Homalodisca vitripennis]|nr:hypothetical protein J6590_008383 [Homalodisca vitripennis]
MELLPRPGPGPRPRSRPRRALDNLPRRDHFLLPSSPRCIPRPVQPLLITGLVITVASVRLRLNNIPNILDLIETFVSRKDLECQAEHQITDHRYHEDSQISGDDDASGTQEELRHVTSVENQYVGQGEGIIDDSVDKERVVVNLEKSDSDIEDSSDLDDVEEQLL